MAMPVAIFALDTLEAGGQAGIGVPTLALRIAVHKPTKTARSRRRIDLSPATLAVLAKHQKS
jgi:hypothetical protein